MVWRRSGDKPLSETIMVSLPTHICLTRPQWFEWSCCSEIWQSVGTCQISEVTDNLNPISRNFEIPWDLIAWYIKALADKDPGLSVSQSSLNADKLTIRLSMQVLISIKHLYNDPSNPTFGLEGESRHTIRTMTTMSTILLKSLSLTWRHPIFNLAEVT